MNALARPTPDPMVRELFLSGMSNAAATVSIVTTDGPAGRFGMTVSAMASVSADTEWPTLLVCIHERSAATAPIIRNGVFCVNVLRDDQSSIADCFAGRTKLAGADRFACAEWTEELPGAPRVRDPLVAFACRLVSTTQVGTHQVVFGRVEHVFVAPGGSPLIYANRAYGSPARLPPPRPPAASGTPVLRIGVFHTFGAYMIPRLVADLTAAMPALDLQLVEGDQHKLADEMARGRIDVALTYVPPHETGLRVERLASLSPYVLLAETHPLAARASLALADLAPEPFVLLEAPPSGAYFLSLFEAAGLEPTVRFRCASVEMVRGFVARGLGYSLLATKPAASMSYDGCSLVTRRLDNRVQPSEVALVTRSGAPLDPLAERFAAACRGVFAAM